MKRENRRGSPVRAAREAAGLTQVQLARRSACSPAFISLVERAPVLLLPTIAPRVARALGTTAAALRARVRTEVLASGRGAAQVVDVLHHFTHRHRRAQGGDREVVAA